MKHEAYDSRAAGPARSRWELAGYAVWLLLAVGIAIRFVVAVNPARNNVYLKVFAPAAEAFAAGGPLYGLDGGFRYPPLCAALLLPFAKSGAILGSILWRGLNLLVLWLGVRATFRSGFPFALDSRERGVFLVLLAVAEVVSFNNGQPNVLILGLMLLATTGVLAARDAGPSLQLTGSTIVKVYPFAYGLVLTVLRPRLLLWLLPLLLLAAALPFLLQKPSYVWEQYQVLATTLAHEDRTGDLSNAYRDLRLLGAAAGFELPDHVFRLLQVLCGAGIAVLALLLRRRVSLPHALYFAFSLTMCWFMLLGPATEKATYALLGPTLAWPLLQAIRRRHRPGMLGWGAVNLLHVLGHVAEPGRDVQAAHPWVRCAMPAAALLATLLLLVEAAIALRRVDRAESA